MLYFDTSALLKIIRIEPETVALRAYLRDHAEQTHVSSALIRAEVARTVLREADADGVPDQRLVTAAQRAVGQLMLWRVSDDVLQATWDVPGPHVRALDAIHVATALRIHEQVSLSAFVTYDKRQADAAQAAGLTVASPRAT
ncbi:MAG: PIN domain-containing protein [Micromonosporaceae bacterium]|nr:PIN domain-containing protein [Micromonosporaceae bacterium]